MFKLSLPSCSDPPDQVPIEGLRVRGVLAQEGISLVERRGAPAVTLGGRSYSPPCLRWWEGLTRSTPEVKTGSQQVTSNPCMGGFFPASMFWHLKNS